MPSNTRFCNYSLAVRLSIEQCDKNNIDSDMHLTSVYQDANKDEYQQFL